MNIDLVAKICHEANRGYCQAIGDFSQPHWEDAPDWQKASARAGVEYHRSNPSSLPKDSHTSWLKEKEADGWKYGPVKDPENKEHPCYMPYEQLPVLQQAKDFIFTAIVKGFLSEELPTERDLVQPPVSE